LIPTIESVRYNFINSGLYDGLFVLQDKETETLWNHMTGEAVYGHHAGLRMEVSNLLNMNVEQALALDADMEIAISDRRYNMIRSTATTYSPSNSDAKLMEQFVVTLGEEDQRRPRMDMGLGIWTGSSQRYYPVETLRNRGNYLVDNVDGRDLLIFLEPLTSTPTAIYWESDKVELEGREFVLSDGYRIQNGQLKTDLGEQVNIEQPQQIFTRWYGFALTFPETEVFQ